jgi:hypothetical protein
MGQDQTGHAAIEIDVPDKFDQRNEDALVGDKHTEQDKREDDIGSAKFPAGQDEAIDGPQEGGENGRRNDQPETVAEVRGQILISGHKVIEMQP